MRCIVYQIVLRYLYGAHKDQPHNLTPSLHITMPSTTHYRPSSRATSDLEEEDRHTRSQYRSNPRLP